MKLKICYFGDGESIHTIRWCKHFASKGHEIHLITFKNVSIENIHIHYINAGKIDVNGGNWKVLLKYTKVKKILKKIKPDIFHAHYATSYGITGALCDYHPYVISTWGSDILIAPFQSRITKLLLKYAFSKADWITVVADHMKIAFKKLNVAKNKISTVTHGVDPLIFNSYKRNPPTDKFIITSTRSFEPIYNIPLLIESFAEVLKKHPNIFLHLIGSGTMKKEIDNLITKLGIKNNVILLGKVPQATIAELLNQSHLFITIASSDGDVVSLAEALACNNFCIATDIPATRKWIKDNENGFLIPINNKNNLIEKILEAYKNYNKLQQTATPFNKEIIEKQGIWDKNMKKVEKKYYELKNLLFN